MTEVKSTTTSCAESWQPSLSSEINQPTEMNKPVTPMKPKPTCAPHPFPTSRTVLIRCASARSSPLDVSRSPSPSSFSRAADGLLVTSGPDRSAVRAALGAAAGQPGWRDADRAPSAPGLLPRAGPPAARRPAARIQRGDGARPGGYGVLVSAAAAAAARHGFRPLRAYCTARALVASRHCPAVRVDAVSAE